VPKRGSCIFVHVAQEDYAPTLGCVALSVGALRRLLRQVEPNDELKIG